MIASDANKIRCVSLVTNNAATANGTVGGPTHRASKSPTKALRNWPNLFILAEGEYIPQPPRHVQLHYVPSPHSQHPATKVVPSRQPVLHVHRSTMHFA